MTRIQWLKHKDEAVAYSQRFQQEVLDYLSSMPAIQKSGWNMKMKGIISTECVYGMIDENGKLIKKEAGFFDRDNNTIWLIFKNIPSWLPLYTVIRHEVCHAVLYNVGFPCEDDTEIFYVLASKFDALPYVTPEKGILHKMGILK